MLPSICDLLPTPDERQRTKDYLEQYLDGEVQMVDLWFRYLIQLPDLKPRTALSIRMMEAQDTYNRCIEPVTSMTDMCRALTEFPHDTHGHCDIAAGECKATPLEWGLQSVLAVGNALNLQTRDKGAHGVHIEWLAKVAE